MKNLIFRSLAFMMLAGSVSVAKAQVAVNVNIGTAPAWVAGYPASNYYYLPDVNMYYDVPRTEYVYLNRGHWVRSRVLPAYCANYDLYRGRKVVVANYRGRHPYRYYRPQPVVYYRGNGHHYGWRHRH